MSTGTSERCPKCGQMKAASKAGSLTQWITVCGCDNLEGLQETTYESIQFCEICAKRISKERKGSLTQFIFRSDVCKCETPRISEDADSPEMVARIAEATRIDLGPSKKELTPEEIEQLAAEFSIAVEKFPFERYSPVKVIGEGASGVVYLANDRYLGKPVAIKCLHHVEAAQLMSFQNEARATSKLNHEGIVTILDFGATALGVPYMVMEFIDGISLSAYLAERKVLTPMDATRITSKLAEALARAHNQNIYHRDVKPSNVLLHGNAARPDIKVIDFGVAQLQSDDDSKTINVDGRVLVGTPAYMAPELASGGEFSPLAEIYSVGCLLFQCLTGRVPFNSDNALVLIQRHANEAPPLVSDISKDVPIQLEQVVSKCLEKNPSDRFQSMKDLADCLKEIADHIYEEDLNSARLEAEKVIADAALGDNLHTSPSSLAAKKSAPSKRNWIITSLLVIFSVGFAFYFYQQSTISSSKTDKEKEVSPVLRKLPDEITNQTDYLDMTFNSIDFNDRLIGTGKGTLKKVYDFLKQHKSAGSVLIRSDELTDKELPMLVQLRPTLFSLSKCTSLTDKGLLEFSKLNTVNHLCLDENPQFTPQGLKNLSVIPHLGELSIKNCDLDSDDIKALSAIKDLYNLDIRGNPKVTLKSLEALRGRSSSMLIMITGCAADKASPADKKKLELKNNLQLSSAQ